MSKKKYYKYKKYSKKGNHELSDSFIEFAIFLVLIVGIGNVIYRKTIEIFLNKYFSTMKFYFYIILGILLAILFVSIGILIYKKFFKKVDKIDNQELNEILNEINNFKQLRNHNSEVQYHMEIAGFLKKTFPNLKIEQTSGNTRPDIVIENVAIEIKGPTTNGGLQTIADKIIRYLKFYDYIIVILFNIEVNRKDFLEWKVDILENFSHKGDKVIIIDK